MLQHADMSMFHMHQVNGRTATSRTLGRFLGCLAGRWVASSDAACGSRYADAMTRNWVNLKLSWSSCAKLSTAFRQTDTWKSVGLALRLLTARRQIGRRVGQWQAAASDGHLPSWARPPQPS